jgi:hypothetical protein
VDSPSDTSPAKHKHRVIVVELDEVVERRRADRPNLYVGTTTQPRVERYGQLRRGAGSKRIRDHIVRSRPDLYGNYSPMTKEQAQRQQ